VKVDAAPVDTFLAHRARFLSLVRARVGEREAAEDLRHQAFTKVIEHPADVPAGREVPWFYGSFVRPSLTVIGAVTSRGVNRKGGKRSTPAGPSPLRRVDCAAATCGHWRP